MTAKLDFSELASLINLNSYTKNKIGVDANAEIFNQWMQALNFDIETHERSHIGNHIHYKSLSQDGPKLLLLGHLDTVFPENTFTDFSEDEDWIYGPGVCDMKGGNYVALQALRAIFNEFGHINNIDMLLVSDEETGSDDSKALTTSLAPQYDACLVFEAAGKNHEVVIERKGVATFNIELTGKAAHAGNHYSEGINANLAAAQLILSLTKLTNLDKGTTVNAGKMKGGIGANTISPHASLIVEARFTHTQERDRVLNAFGEIHQYFDVKGIECNVSGGLQRDVMQSTKAQQSLIADIESTLGYPLLLEKRGGVSDANVVSAQGVPTLDGFGPFGDGDHTVNERASKESFVRRIDETTKILRLFAK